jgi:hypothetical protein
MIWLKYFDCENSAVWTDGLERLVYGVKSITSGLQNAIPLIKDSQPYLYSFVFERHHVGNIPRQAGKP